MAATPEQIDLSQMVINPRPGNGPLEGGASSIVFYDNLAEWEQPAVLDEFQIGENFTEFFPETEGVDGLMERLFRNDASVVDVAGAEYPAGITINRASVEGTRDHRVEYSGEIFPTVPLPPIGFGFPLLPSENPAEAEETYARADRE